MAIDNPNEFTESQMLARAMSREYCRQLKDLLPESQMDDLLSRINDSDRESRCASERYGIDAGKLMRAAWKAVSGDTAAEQDFDIDATWVDGRPIRAHLQSAFFWNRQANYWTNQEG